MLNFQILLHTHGTLSFCLRYQMGWTWLDFEGSLLDYCFYSSIWPQHAVQQVQCSPFVRDLRSFITWLYTSIGKLQLYIQQYATPPSSPALFLQIDFTRTRMFWKTETKSIQNLLKVVLVLPDTTSLIILLIRFYPCLDHEQTAYVNQLREAESGK